MHGTVIQSRDRYTAEYNKACDCFISAVFLLTAQGDNVRSLLLTAHSLGFNNGEFAFLTVEAFRGKRLGNFGWFREDDPPERNQVRGKRTR